MKLRSGKIIGEYLQNNIGYPKLIDVIDTISKNEKQKYKVEIDFDEASIQWRKNKIILDEGYFKYKE